MRLPAPDPGGCKRCGHRLRHVTRAGPKIGTKTPDGEPLRTNLHVNDDGELRALDCIACDDCGAAGHVVQTLDGVVTQRVGPAVDAAAAARTRRERPATGTDASEVVADD